MIAPETRDQHHRIFMGLLFRTGSEIRAQGYSKLCGTDATPVRRLGQRGISIDIIGPACDMWGGVRYPYIWAPERSWETLSDCWGRMLRLQELRIEEQRRPGSAQM